MKLMQFLAVGQSLIGIGNKPSPYRIAKQNWFPKFGSAESSRSPFSEPTTLAAPSPAASESIALEKRGGVRAERKSCFGEGSGSAVGSTTIQPARVAAAPAQPVRQDRKAVKSRWLSWRRTAKAAGPLRQAELTLDQVEVVRNDLSDCDFEVIPRLLGKIGPRSGLAAKSMSQTESNRLAGRLYQAVRTVV